MAGYGGGRAAQQAPNVGQDIVGAILGPWWDRMGKIQQESSAFADQGAKSFREQGNPLGLGQMALGAAGWLGSPIGALVPRGIEQDPLVPETLKPAVKGAVDFADFFLPGPNEFLAPAQAISIPMTLASRAQLRTLPQFEQRSQELANDARSLAEYNQGVQRIWEETGWDRPSIDGIPRTEIRDDRASLTAPDTWGRFTVDDAGMPTYRGTLATFYNHPELYAQLPDLRDIATELKFNNKAESVSGGYSPVFDRIRLESPINAKESDLLGLIAHETNHGVDGRAGLLDPAKFYKSAERSQIGDVDLIAAALAQAGAKDIDPAKFYTRLAHENTAYNTWQRLENPELYAYALSLTNPVPIEQQIFDYVSRDPRVGLTPRQLEGIRRR